VKAERLLESIHSALAADGEDWLNTGEHASIDTAMAGLRLAMTQRDADKIRLAASALNELCLPFAARRMDEAVRKALTGRQLADLA